jgi:ubiquitin-conjugating enzyme E2 M
MHGQTAAEIRAHRELDALPDEHLPQCIKYEAIDTASIEDKGQSVKWALVLETFIIPEEGPYARATVPFRVFIPQTYPFVPPKVRCTTRIFHPNIEAPTKSSTSGTTSLGVCLNILRLDWSPALGIRAILLGLLNILLEPTAEEPLEGGPAFLLESDPALFSSVVKSTLSGGIFDGIQYDTLLNL